MSGVSKCKVKRLDLKLDILFLISFIYVFHLHGMIYKNCQRGTQKFYYFQYYGVSSLRACTLYFASAWLSEFALTFFFLKAPC